MRSGLLLALSMLLGQGAWAAPDGVVLYAQHCAACHQADGTGTVGLAPPLKGEHWGRRGAARAYLATVLLHGLSGPIAVNGQRFVGSMPAFAGQLDDSALAALASHLVVLQGRGDAPYTAGEVKAAREAGGSPPQSRERRQQLLR